MNTYEKRKYKSEEVTIGLLHRLVRCDLESGELFWRERPIEFFRTSAEFVRWNGRYAGKQCGFIRRDGYRKFSLFKNSFSVARVVWAMAHGEWPDYVDHINGVRDDNRIVNLRSVSIHENTRNQRTRVDSPLNCAGVRFRKGKWEAYIGVDYKQVHLGVFRTFGEAKEKRKLAEMEHGFHPNHNAYGGFSAYHGSSA